MKRIVGVSTVIVVATAAMLFQATMTPNEASCLDPELCRPQQTRLDDHGYLRAVSLDIRGVVPSAEEHDRMDAEGIEGMLDEWLVSEQFQQRVVRRHQALLWPNIENQTRLYHYRRAVARYDGDDTWRQSNGQTLIAYRGADVGCLDEPATFDASGRPVTRDVGDGAQREGYVMVRPYWAPDTELKVCAFDAQTTEVSPSGNDCASRSGIGDPGCGCGPNLRWCHTSSARAEVLRSFNEEFDHRVAAHIARDEPYHELLTSRVAYVNGPLATFWRHHRLTSSNLHLVPDSLDIPSLPLTDIDADEANPQLAPDSAIAFEEDERWEEVMLPEHHAGLLTHPVFLLRFQTNRARANRFHNAFLCEPFQPPEGGIELDDPVDNLQSDVQLRPGCNYCHAILEPAAAHWGRWTQQGGGFLDPALFPEYRDECADCGRGLETCSDLCSFNYVTRALTPAEEPYLGRLTAFRFLRDEHRPNVEAGPAALVRQGVADGRFTSCAVQNTVTWLFGRDVRPEEEEMVREVTHQFLESDFRYRELVRAVVLSETYRRAL